MSLYRSTFKALCSFFVLNMLRTPENHHNVFSHLFISYHSFSRCFQPQVFSPYGCWTADTAAQHSKMSTYYEHHLLIMSRHWSSCLTNPRMLWLFSVFCNVHPAWHLACWGLNICRFYLNSQKVLHDVVQNESDI